MRPHRRQPTRLRHPWDSPGKNTGVGCHFLLQCMKVKSENEVASVMSDSSRPHELQPTRLLRLRDFPGESTGVGCHFLLQGIIPTQGLNPGLLHCRQTLYHLSHQGSSKNAPMLCYAKSLQLCPTLCDPIDGSPPGSPSLGFSRQEPWSGLPFPSPMYESEK